MDLSIKLIEYFIAWTYGSRCKAIYQGPCDYVVSSQPQGSASQVPTWSSLLDIAEYSSRGLCNMSKWASFSFIWSVSYLLSCSVSLLNYVLFLNFQFSSFFHFLGIFSPRLHCSTLSVLNFLVCVLSAFYCWASCLIHQRFFLCASYSGFRSLFFINRHLVFFSSFSR
jgi:hypothetical protein